VAAQWLFTGAEPLTGSRNLTQKEVAERAGISQPALSRIELGGGVPDLETLRRLGNAMGVRFHVIVGAQDAE
jgi:transcriptional regulator with XRE-family HTH domain